MKERLPRHPVCRKGMEKAHEKTRQIALPGLFKYMKGQVMRQRDDAAREESTRYPE